MAALRTVHDAAAFPLLDVWTIHFVQQGIYNTDTTFVEVHLERQPTWRFPSYSYNK
jgi:hypothetical protein